MTDTPPFPRLLCPSLATPSPVPHFILDALLVLGVRSYTGCSVDLLVRRFALCNQTPLPHSTAAGLQVAEYMEEMAEDSEENYNKHFSQFIAADLDGGGLEDVLKEVWPSFQTRAYCTQMLPHSVP